MKNDTLHKVLEALPEFLRKVFSILHKVKNQSPFAP